MDIVSSSQHIPALHNFKFNILGEALNHFVLNSSDPVSVKDTRYGHYILTNEANLKILGLQNKTDFIGLTIYDVHAFMKPFWGNAFMNWSESTDQKVCQTKKMIIEPQKQFLDKNGLLRIQNIKKIPLLDPDNNSVSLILTISTDLTRHYDDFELFKLYQKIYVQKHQGALHFMKYLNIAQFFLHLLTNKELLCLLHMKRDHTPQSISKKMCLSLKQVENHMKSIVSKSTHSTLSTILIFLRNHHERAF